MASKDVSAFEPATDTRGKAVSLVRKGTPWLTRASVDAMATDQRSSSTAEGSDAASIADRWVEEQKIFGIELDGAMRFPAYAFDTSGQPVPALFEVLQSLVYMCPFEIAAWFESTSSALGGARPRELLAREPDAVITAARSLRDGPLHG